VTGIEPAWPAWKSGNRSIWQEPFQLIERHFSDSTNRKVMQRALHGRYLLRRRQARLFLDLCGSPSTPWAKCGFTSGHRHAQSPPSIIRWIRCPFEYDADCGCCHKGNAPTHTCGSVRGPKPSSSSHLLSEAAASAKFLAASLSCNLCSTAIPSRTCNRSMTLLASFRSSSRNCGSIGTPGSVDMDTVLCRLDPSSSHS